MTDKTKDFIQRLKDSGHWNDDYDYSKVNYINRRTKVIVIDRKFQTEHLMDTQQLTRGVKCSSTNVIGGYLNFIIAKEYVRSLGLSSLQEWTDWSKNGNRPHNIPGNPNAFYKDKGWVSLGDWLGYDNSILPFNEARTFVRDLSLKSSKEWKEYCESGNKPKNIPVSPSSVYKNNGFVSISDWLGTKVGFDGYLSFNEARKYAHTLNFTSVRQWESFSKTSTKPHNVPSAPNIMYSSEWKSWGDWLGTKVGFDGFLPFEEARSYVHTLNLKNNNEWREYCKSGNKPDNIPAFPQKPYINDGWLSMADWLGTKVGFDGFLPFQEARSFVHGLKLKNNDDWITYRVSDDKPHNIPTNPNTFYKDKGWVSLGDWLGTNRIADRFKTYIPFEEARSFVHGLKLSSMNEWREYCKSGNKPDNIPSCPYISYKNDGWIDASDWLNTNYVATYNRDYLPFEEARKFVQNLNLKSQDEWLDYCRSGKKPDNIPSSPVKVYENNGWLSVADWIGTKVGFDGLLPFKEAKEFVINLKLNNISEWESFCKSDNIPHNIPLSPQVVYKNKGWVSLVDFLGLIGNGVHNWTKVNLIHFIKSLENELNNLDSVELITIINSNNLSKKLRELGNLENLVSTQAGSEERANLVRSIIEQLEDIDEEDVVATTETQENNTEFDGVLQVGPVTEITEEVTERELQPLNPIQELHMYDNTMITASLDDENIDFLLKNQLKKLWNKVLNNKVDIESFRNETGGDKFTIVKNWFFNEYEEVVRIDSPSDYIFKYQPNLMQKLITYRLINEKRYGNWSGTGAGKTLSAIFAGRYAGVKNTLIICNNATVEGWANSINDYFSNNRIYTKRMLDYTDPKTYYIIDKYDVNFVEGENNYLILNYETFQLEDGEYIVSELLKNNRIDYIILDEVQNVKQRDDEESTRRNVVSKLIIHSKEKNEDLLVLAMSATPVINNLTEPKKLIELLTGELHDELSTTESIINGIEMYKALTRHGLRYKPSYGISVNEEIIELDGQHLAEKIIRIPRGAVVDFERVLIETKLDGVQSKIKKGTLIYTHYVTELSHTIGDYVKNLGFSVGYYTGEDKSGLRPFKEGKIDVLIGSAPVGTGVDGIQYVCNTLIPIVLPWTSSEYDQLVGRIDRQGSHFDHVNIYIPQVIIPTGENIWSWDRRRHNIIRFKATLADLAVDGRVPRNLLPSKTELIEEAKKELTDWVNRLQAGDYITFEREEMTIPLNPRLFERNRTQLGDFSELNQRWSVTRSDNTHDRLVKDPSEWYYYHTLYSEKRKTWSEIPFMEIAKKINVRPDWIVGDFGCGENLLSKEIRNTVYAFDHVAIDDKVYTCDIKNVPIEDGVLDVAVFSLSLMGSNYTDYFKEAYRTLKVYGNIFVCEPASKWEGREEELKICIESVGFKCFGTVKNTDKFIYIDGIKY